MQAANILGKLQNAMLKLTINVWLAHFGPRKVNFFCLRRRPVAQALTQRNEHTALCTVTRKIRQPQRRRWAFFANKIACKKPTPRIFYTPINKPTTRNAILKRTKDACLRLDHGIKILSPWSTAGRQL